MNPGAGMPTSDVRRRTVCIGKRRVRLTLEQEYWAGLAEIAEREDMSVDELLTETNRRRGAATLPDAIRVLCAGYFRRAAIAPGNLELALVQATGVGASAALTGS